MVLAPQVQDLLNDFIRRSVRMAPANRLGVAKTLNTGPSIGIAPSIETGTDDAELSTSSDDGANPVGVLKNAELALYLTLILIHWKHPPSSIRRLQDVSCEVVHIYKSRNSLVTVRQG
jgi:hypothetical protein